MNRKCILLSLAIIVCLVFLCQTGSAKEKARLHPRNRKLIKLGLMPYPKYYPEIPRITAREALALYKQHKALFILISHQDLHLIVGGIHLTEGEYPRIDPNRLPLKKGQVLVLY